MIGIIQASNMGSYICDGCGHTKTFRVTLPDDWMSITYQGKEYHFCDKCKNLSAHFVERNIYGA